MNAPATLPTITADGFYRMGEAGRGYELIDGHLEEKHASTQASRIASEVNYHLCSHVRKQNYGFVFTSEQGYQIFADHPERVRKPDVSFIARDRLSREDYLVEGWCTVVPDLVVEVVSPNDVAYVVESKISQWLAAGVRAVWIVYPNEQRVYIHESRDQCAVLKPGDILRCESILPGFACPVAELFPLS